MSSFLLKRLSFVFFIAIASLVVIDVNKHGSFKGSKTGVFLKDSGALEFGERVLTNFRSYSQQAYRWGQKNVPRYQTWARENVAPYLVKVRDVLTTLALQLWTNVKLICQYFVDKKPSVVQWVNYYIPGLVDSVGLWVSTSWTLVLKYLTLVLQWLKDNIFVGKLSAENLQMYTSAAINTTHSLALQTLSWFNAHLVPISHK